MKFDSILAKYPQLTSKPYFAIVDFTIRADSHRLLIFDSSTKELVYSWYTSHGSGSGPRTGEFLVFSNVPNSRCSSAGLYRIGEYYFGKYGHTRRLDGLEKGINDKARERAVVLHESDYVRESFIRDNDFPGRSWGCITLRPEDKERLYKKELAEGNYLYVFTSTDLK